MLSVLLLPCQRRREGWPGWEGEGEGEEGVEVEKVVVSGAWGELRPRESVRKGEEDTRSERPKMRRRGQRRGRRQSRAGQSRTEQGRAGQGRAGQGSSRLTRGSERESGTRHLPPRGNLTFRLGLREPTDPGRRGGEGGERRERGSTESYAESLYAMSVY